MFDEVLIGVDGLSGGREAIALARQLVSETGRLVFANVYRGALAGRGLHQLAADEHADLLVVGSSHRSAVGRLLLGDDTQAALNGAPCAVAIAPRGYALGGGAWTTIGVGDDGSAEAALAREAACVLAERHHATVRLRSVVGQQRVPAYEDEPPEWTTATVEALERERQRLGEIEGVVGDVVYGDASEELARFAAEVDLLIVGSRGAGPLGRLINGSTSTYLAGHSPRPLLVIPRCLTKSGQEPSDGVHLEKAQAIGAPGADRGGVFADSAGLLAPNHAQL